MNAKGPEMAQVALSPGESCLSPASPEDWHIVQRFLFEEAALLDQRRYRDWLRLFAPQFEYRVPARFHRQQDGLKDDWAINRELSGDDELPVVSHDRASMEAQIIRIESGRAASDLPPWFTTRLITNVIAHYDAGASHFHVRSNFLIQRYKRGREQFIAGSRQDVLVRHDRDLSIASRQVVLGSDVYRWSNFALI